MLDTIFSNNLLAVFFELFDQEETQGKVWNDLQCAHFKDLMLNTFIPKRRRETIQFISSKIEHNGKSFFPAEKLFHFLHNQDIMEVVIALLNTEGKLLHPFPFFPLKN